MHNPDPQEEWRLLRETYGLMTEDEIATVAEGAYDLTPMAQEVLQSIIREKGWNVRLNMQPSQQAPVAVPPNDLDLESFGWAMSLDEARRTKRILDAAFVPSFLGPDNIMNLEDFKGGFERGVEVKVRPVDRHRAQAAMAEAALQEDDGTPDPEESKEYAVLCPKCRSQEVVFEESDPGATGSPLDTKFNWSCDACGYKWQDEGIAQQL
jgi:DNA-directed RNA polymerase subunit M/transcription elongation factor TFIIS